MPETLTKACIVERLCMDTKLEKAQAKKLVDDFFTMIRDVLSMGHHLKFSGFGNFLLRNKNARPGRNPKTGQFILVEERRVVTFQPGQKLRSQVENN